MIAAMLLLLIFTACLSDAAEEEYIPIILREIYETHETEEIYEPEDNCEYEEEPEYEPKIIIESVIPLDMALRYFQKLETVWDAENGEIWGTSLHAPVLIVCAETRDAVANMPDTQGRLIRQYVDGGAVYAGKYCSQGFVGLTAVSWSGRSWGMVTWQFMEKMYDGSEVILTVMAHEAFHALQPEMFGIRGARGIPGASMCTRIYFELEINALVKAFGSSGDERLSSIEHALSIRHHRRQNFATARDENLMEVSEGLAVYTVDLRLFLYRDRIEAVAASWPEMFKNINSSSAVAIMFGYHSGALYALLLEDLGTDWKGYVNPYTDLGQLLKEAVGITELAPLEEIDLTPYGYDEIAARLR